MKSFRKPTRLDGVLGAVQNSLAVVSGAPPSSRPDPAAEQRRHAPEMSAVEKRESAALMRVNHVGEICAQALYEGQALAARDPRLREQFRRAAVEESDHLSWTRGRVEELGHRVSLLAPLWYAGAFGIGTAAALLGDRTSLGFMAETEDQVEEHLNSHLGRLPAGDSISRAIVAQMKQDEVGHARTARALGGQDLPLPVRLAMKMAARVMTSTAYWI
jgi:ubiquinone biosynthesis monooxygenase Coq7